jgi:hypothetical protein
MAHNRQLGKTRIHGVATRAIGHSTALVCSPKVGLDHRFPLACQVAATIQIPVTSSWRSTYAR